MNDSELEFDRNVHVIYSGRCREILRSLIEKHYGKERLEEVWEKVQKQYVSFLAGYRTDLGGKKNFHNGECGTYDCIAFFSYYVVCRDVTSFEEIEKAYGDLFLPSFAKLSFVDCNKPVFMSHEYRFPHLRKEMREVEGLRHEGGAIHKGRIHQIPLLFMSRRRIRKGA